MVQCRCFLSVMSSYSLYAKCTSLNNNHDSFGAFFPKMEENLMFFVIKGQKAEKTQYMPPYGAQGRKQDYNYVYYM